jgi:hypothetical protein
MYVCMYICMYVKSFLDGMRKEGAVAYSVSIYKSY